MSHILFVCTANICRSPAAEYLARARFGTLDHEFSSAGFLYDDRPAEPDMVTTLAGVGVDASTHRSRIISADLVASVDLVLTMEARHVQDIALLSEAAFFKTIPLMEAVDRVRPGMTVTEFVDSLGARSPMTYFDTKWDVEDPYRRSKRKYRKSVDRIGELVEQIVPVLS